PMDLSSPRAGESRRCDRQNTKERSMRRVRVSAGLVCLVLVSSVSQAGPPPTAAAADDVSALAARIDQLIEVGCGVNGVKQAPLADASEFVRRIYLDLAGRIPHVSEVHKFLVEKSPNKRRELVEELLKGPHYVNHLTNVWRALVLPQNNDPQVQFLANQIEGWLRPRLRDNKPYDQMVRELLTAPVTINRGRVLQAGSNDAGAAAFFQANESKPENVAAATSRLFLGIKLECAQCHNHPFASWSRNQFWQFAAFFSGIRPQQPQAGV